MNETAATVPHGGQNVLRPTSGPVFLPANAGNLTLDSVMIGIVTILPYEYAAVCEVLGCNKEEFATGGSGARKYKLGTVLQPSRKSGVNVAVVQLIGAGLTDSAVIANSLLHDCPNIREIIVCGIAGAVPSPMKGEDHVRFGDIVVSGNEGVLQYDYGKALPNRFEVRGTPYRPSRSLLQSARALQSDEEKGLRPWEAYIDSGEKALGDDYRRPGESTDVLCEPHWPDLFRLRSNLYGLYKEYRSQRAQYPPIPHPPDSVRDKNPGRPRVFHGLIASANQVLGDRRTREVLRRTYKAKAVEMEAAGAAHAAYSGNVGYFVVRGTVDYCNEHKNDIWHRYAALVAAAYTKALIEATNPRVFDGPNKVLAIVIPGISEFESPQGSRDPLPEGYAETVVKEINLTDLATNQSANATEPSTPPLTTGDARDIPPLLAHRIDVALTMPMAKMSGTIHGVVAPPPHSRNARGNGDGVTKDRLRARAAKCHRLIATRTSIVDIRGRAAA